MTNLLLLTSSLSGPDSKSSQIANEFVASWQAAHGPARIVHREVGHGHIPHLTAEHVKAWMTPPEQHSPRERELTGESDPLLEELEAANVIVIGVPMYNFGIPSTLKAWLDHVTRAGRTFRYTANGPEGMLKNKKVFVIAARGGVYSGDSPAKPFDFQEPYLRTILGFNGLTDVTFIHVEGLKVSPEAAGLGVARARAQVGALTARAAA